MEILGMIFMYLLGNIIIGGIFVKVQERSKWRKGGVEDIADLLRFLAFCNIIFVMGLILFLIF